MKMSEFLASHQVLFTLVNITADITSFICILCIILLNTNKDFDIYYPATDQLLSLWLFSIILQFCVSFIIEYTFYIQNTNRTDWIGFVGGVFCFIFYVLFFMIPRFMIIELLSPMLQLSKLIFKTFNLQLSNNKCNIQQNQENQENERDKIGC